MEPAPQWADDPTIWDGVFSSEQAQRGEQAAWANCYSCHSAHEWSSEAFMRASNPWRLGDMFSTIRRSMPYDSPGSLPDATYADILAYILSLQDAPPGPRDLPQNIRELDEIMVTPPPY